MLKHMQPPGLENWLSGAHVTSSGRILDFYQAHAQLFSLQVPGYNVIIYIRPPPTCILGWS